MTNKTILDDVHETAKGLHKAGAMGATTMRPMHCRNISAVSSYQLNATKRCIFLCVANS